MANVPQTALYQIIYYFHQSSTCLEQCPYDTNHYVPSSSLESHKARCWYSSQGVKLGREDAELLAARGAFYEQTNIPQTHISMYYF